MDVSLNPISTFIDPLFISAWFPSLHTLIDQHSQQKVREISCFERFGDLAFKEIPREIKSIAEVVGGVTLSNNNSPDNIKTTRIYLKSILPSTEAIRHLDYEDQTL